MDVFHSPEFEKVKFVSIPLIYAQGFNEQLLCALISLIFIIIQFLEVRPTMGITVQIKNNNDIAYVSNKMKELFPYYYNIDHNTGILNKNTG